MKIDNFTNVVSYPAFQLLPKEPHEIKPLLNKWLTVKGSPEEQDVLDSITEDAPEWISAECKNLGVNHVCHSVPVYVRLGNIIFDLYSHTVVAPTAPLAKALLNKKMGEYAETLNSDTFELPGEVKNGLEKVLMDDKIWRTVNVNAWFGNEKEDLAKTITLTGGGLARHGSIMSALLNIFIQEQ